jgi:hypothetical protein
MMAQGYQPTAEMHEGTAGTRTGILFKRTTQGYTWSIAVDTEATEEQVVEMMRLAFLANELAVGTVGDQVATPRS